MFVNNWKNKIENVVENYLNSEVFYINIGTGNASETVEDTELQYKSDNENKQELDRNFDTENNLLLLSFYLSTTEFNDLPNDVYDENSLNYEVSFGGTKELAIKYTPTATTKVKKVCLYLKYLSGTANNITVEIQGDDSGTPNGTPITNGTATISSFTDTEFSWKEAVFSSPPQLTEGTIYWIVIKSPSSSDDAYSSGAYQTTGGDDLQKTDAGYTSGYTFLRKIYITHFSEVGLYTSDGTLISRNTLSPLAKDVNYEYIMDFEISYTTNINV